MTELEFWKNHLAKLYQQYVTDLDNNKDAELELNLLEETTHE
jgi:hypothetical protein